MLYITLSHLLKVLHLSRMLKYTLYVKQSSNIFFLFLLNSSQKSDCFTSYHRTPPIYPRGFPLHFYTPLIRRVRAPGLSPVQSHLYAITLQPKFYCRRQATGWFKGLCHLSTFRVHAYKLVVWRGGKLWPRRMPPVDSGTW